MEPLFRPSTLVFPEDMPLPNTKDLKDLLKESVESCNPEWQSSFKSSGTLFICGGVSCLSGFMGRIQSEVREIFGGNVLIKTLPEDVRMNSAWMGGALLSRDGHLNFISLQEYNEEGPDIVKRKCLL